MKTTNDWFTKFISFDNCKGDITKAPTFGICWDQSSHYYFFIVLLINLELFEIEEIACA
jgi:hypothetical protein